MSGFEGTYKKAYMDLLAEHESLLEAYRALRTERDEAFQRLRSALERFETRP